MAQRPNLYTTPEERREYNNRKYMLHKERDPEWHRQYVTRIVRQQRQRVHGVVGAPDEHPDDCCAFPGCDKTRKDFKRGLHADHDHAITDGRPNFRGWLCLKHNIAVGFFEKYADQCREYLRGATL